MVKRIIVEGADQQGKTEFCKLLQQQIGWKVVKFDKPKEDFNFIQDYITEEQTICDRNFLSEIVYSKIRGQECRIEDVDTLCAILNAKDTIVVVLDRGNDFIFDYSREEMYAEIQIRRAIIEYRAQFQKLKHIRKFKINPNDSNSLKSIVISIKSNLG